MSNLIKNADGTVSKIVATEVVTLEDLQVQAKDAEQLLADKQSLVKEYLKLTGIPQVADVPPVVQEEVPVSETPVAETPAPVELPQEAPAPVELPTPEAPVEQPAPVEAPAPVATPEGVTVNGLPVQPNADGTLVVDTTPDFVIQ